MAFSLRWRLGITSGPYLAAGHGVSCICGRSLTGRSGFALDHFLTCIKFKGGLVKTICHDTAMRDMIFTAARGIGVACDKEVMLGGGVQIDLRFFPPDDCPHESPFCVDFTRFHPTAKSLLQHSQSLSTYMRLFHYRATQKDTRNQHAVHSHSMKHYPFVMSSYGAIDSNSLKLVKRLDRYSLPLCPGRYTRGGFRRFLLKSFRFNALRANFKLVKFGIQACLSRSNIFPPQPRALRSSIFSLPLRISDARVRCKPSCGHDPSLLVDDDLSDCSDDDPFSLGRRPRRTIRRICHPRCDFHQSSFCLMCGIQRRRGQRGVGRKKRMLAIASHPFMSRSVAGHAPAAFYASTIC